jgi:hypothetical protein
VRTANAQNSPRTSRRNPRTIVVWTLVALVGAAGWAVLALARGENVSAAWMVAAALGSYAIGNRRTHDRGSAAADSAAEHKTSPSETHPISGRGVPNGGPVPYISCALNR